MRLKTWFLTALLAVLLGLTACGEQGPPTADTTGVSGISLVSYTNEELGIRFVAPEGWVEVKPGQFQREPGADPTLLGQVLFPGESIDQVANQWRLPERGG